MVLRGGSRLLEWGLPEEPETRGLSSPGPGHPHLAFPVAEPAPLHGCAASWSHSHVKDLELGQELKSCPEPSIGIRENVLMSFKIRRKIPSSAEEQVLICNISIFVFIPKHLVKCNFRILLRRKAKRHKHVKGSQKPVGPRLRPAVALSGLVLP